MKHRSVFVVVPSLSPTGPIKGAIALCNGLAKKLPVTLVNLKNGPGAYTPLHTEVKVLSLAEKANWRTKKTELVQLFHKGGGRKHVVSISCCFSADCLNSLMGNHATIISNVRGNLLKNYRFEYGIPGMFAALLHFFILKRFDRIIAMSDRMAEQLGHFGLRRISIIGNFVDETALELYRCCNLHSGDIPRFIFLASLSFRKRPDLLIQAVHSLKKKGINCHLDILGSGPLKQKLVEKAKKFGISNRVKFYGYISEPYKILQSADYLVIPSQSEGVSRAVMESLFFGVPCILRNVDANKEIIKDNYNGFLFRNDRDIADVMKKAINTSQAKKNTNRNILLPPKFRQKNCIEQYLSLLESLL